MKERSEQLLKTFLGIEGFEELSKTMYRRDSKSILSPIDMYLPVLAVPRTILSWLVQNIKPMAINDEKTIKYPGLENFDIVIRKTGIDAYTAQFMDHGKIVHAFENQTLPAFGGHLMSLTESYDEPKYNHTKPEKNEIEVHGNYDVPTALMQASNIEMPKIPNNEVVLGILSESVKILGKVIDSIMENRFALNVLDTAKEDVKKRSIHETETFSGQAVPSAQIGPLKPIGQSRNPKASQFKQIVQQTKGQPKAEINKNPEMIQRKIAQATVKQGTNKPEASIYFKSFLNKAKMEKREAEFTISEQALYTPCPHCRVPEFVKTEAGPKYSPCACFYITSNEKKKNSFVRLSKSENGYNLSFSVKADPEIVEAFIKTFKNKIHAKYK